MNHWMAIEAEIAKASPQPLVASDFGRALSDG